MKLNSTFETVTLTHHHSVIDVSSETFQRELKCCDLDINELKQPWQDCRAALIPPQLQLLLFPNVEVKATKNLGTSLSPSYKNRSVLVLYSLCFFAFFIFNKKKNLFHYFKIGETFVFKPLVKM